MAEMAERECHVAAVHPIGPWGCDSGVTFGCAGPSQMWISTHSCRGLFECGQPLRQVGCGTGSKGHASGGITRIRCSCDEQNASAETLSVQQQLRSHAEVMRTAQEHQRTLETQGGTSLVAQHMFQLVPHAVVDFRLLQELQRHPQFAGAVNLVHINMTTRRPTIPLEPSSSNLPPAFLFNPSVLDHANMLLKVGTYGRCEIGTGRHTNSYRKGSFRLSTPEANAPDTIAPDRWTVWLRHHTIHGVYRYSEDARPVRLLGRMHMVFTRKLRGYGTRMYLASLEPAYHEVLLNYSRMRSQEKNWVPFVYNDTLHMSYSLCPHQVLRW
jgi:hypothetical protein